MTILVTIMIKIVIKSKEHHILCYLKYVAEVKSLSLEESVINLQLIYILFFPCLPQGFEAWGLSSEKIFLIIQKTFRKWHIHPPAPFLPFSLPPSFIPPSFHPFLLYCSLASYLWGESRGSVAKNEPIFFMPFWDISDNLIQGPANYGL